MLVVEDDAATAVFVATTCVPTVSRRVASDAGEGIRAVEVRPPALLLLDVMLGDGHGRELLDRVRSADGLSRIDPEVPCSCCRPNGATDRVRGFARGCDDYVGKPFSYPELHARIRGASARGRPLRRGRCARRADDRSISAASARRRAVHLSAKEFSLLQALAADPDGVFPKGQLLRDVWGYVAMGTRTLDAHACRLRRSSLDPPGLRAEPARRRLPADGGVVILGDAADGEMGACALLVVGLRRRAELVARAEHELSRPADRVRARARSAPPPAGGPPPRADRPRRGGLAVAGRGRPRPRRSTARRARPGPDCVEVRRAVRREQRSAGARRPGGAEGTVVRVAGGQRVRSRGSRAGSRRRSGTCSRTRGSTRPVSSRSAARRSEAGLRDRGRGLRRRRDRAHRRQRRRGRGLGDRRGVAEQCGRAAGRSADRRRRRLCCRGGAADRPSGLTGGRDAGGDRSQAAAASRGAVMAVGAMGSALSPRGASMTGCRRSSRAHRRARSRHCRDPGDRRARGPGAAADRAGSDRPPGCPQAVPRHTTRSARRLRPRARGRGDRSRWAPYLTAPMLRNPGCRQHNHIGVASDSELSSRWRSEAGVSTSRRPACRRGWTSWWRDGGEKRRRAGPSYAGGHGAAWSVLGPLGRAMWTTATMALPGDHGGSASDRQIWRGVREGRSNFAREVRLLAQSRVTGTGSAARRGRRRPLLSASSRAVRRRRTGRGGRRRPTVRKSPCSTTPGRRLQTAAARSAIAPWERGARRSRM